MGSITTTTRLRLPAGPHDAELDRMGVLFGQLERRLHVHLCNLDRGQIREGEPADRNALKVAFCARHGITARHYNSLLRALDGKHSAVVAKAKLDIEDLGDRLKAVEKKIASAIKKLKADVDAVAGIALRAAAGKAPTKAQERDRLSDVDRKALRRGLHGRKRRRAKLVARIARARQIAAMQVPPIVFGSAKLLRSQPPDVKSPDFALWKLTWREARSAQIFCVGSKDEPGGSQTCRPLWADWERGAIGLRLRRLGPAGEGEAPHIDIHGLDLHAHAIAVLKPVMDLFRAGKSQAITVRLLRTPSEKAAPVGLSPWEALITVEEAVLDTAFSTARPVLGVDVNADHLAWALISPDGNRLKTGRIALPFERLSAEARQSLTCEAASKLVKVAKREGAQIALEDLDFARKKRELAITNASAARRRKLHALPYAAILEAIRRRAARSGIPVRTVNPAYTSIIGRVNFATRQGISTHRAAALAIGRRAQGHSERAHYHSPGSGASDPPLGAVQPRRHVWRQWAQIRAEVSRLDAVARKSAESRTGGESPCPGPGPFRGKRPAPCRATSPMSVQDEDWIPYVTGFPKAPNLIPTGDTVTPTAPDLSGAGQILKALS